MLEKAIYKNHLNETIEMGYGSGIFCNAGDIRDFAYSVTTRNGRISAFSKGVVRRTLPVIIACTFTVYKFRPAKWNFFLSYFIFL